MNRLIACAGLAALLAACEPTTLFECKQSAAKSPTQAGVAVAAASCEQKFGHPQFDDSDFRANPSK